MKTLYKTESTPAVSKDIGRGSSRPGVAWFEMVLHDGPADEGTWEGGGQTVAYWRENFGRLRDPYPWRIEASGVEGTSRRHSRRSHPESLRDDDRISFVWTFIDETVARTQP